MKAIYKTTYNLDSDNTLEELFKVLNDNFDYAFNNTCNFEKYHIDDFTWDVKTYPSKSEFHFIVSSNHSLEQCERFLNDLASLKNENAKSFSIFYSYNSIKEYNWVVDDDSGKCVHKLESLQFISTKNGVKEIVKCIKCNKVLQRKVDELSE